MSATAKPVPAPSFRAKITSKADFIIGAHAALRGYTLLTLDGQLYKAAFPALKIVSN